LDLQELTQLRTQATRPAVQAYLDASAKELERKLQQSKKREEENAKKPPVLVGSAGLPMTKIITYGN
jgi:hypothetical protein